METKILQITSGKGPAECCLAVALAVREINSEANKLGHKVEILSRVAGPENGTLTSASIKIEGKEISNFISSWIGPLLWITQSPYRKFHKRKNWFIGIYESSSSTFYELNEKDVTYQTMRASGPGGQNVNKTETAVRAIHQPTGLFVTASDSRSQLQNKQLALARLKEKFILWQNNKLAENEANDPRQYNNTLERGNPNRIYSGREFLKN